MQPESLESKTIGYKIKYILKQSDLEVIVPFQQANLEMIFKCEECQKTFSRMPKDFLKSQSCPYCQMEDLGAFLKELAQKKGEEYRILGTYINIQTPTLFEHTPCGFKWKCRPSKILGEASCPRCRRAATVKTLQLND